METAAWEKAHAQAFYSAAKGSSPVDAVWTQMAKAEEDAISRATDKERKIAQKEMESRTGGKANIIIKP